MLKAQATRHKAQERSKAQDRKAKKVPRLEGPFKNANVQLSCLLLSCLVFFDLDLSSWLLTLVPYLYLVPCTLPKPVGALALYQ